MICQTYFDSTRPRIDTVCVANISYLFCLAGRAVDVKKSEEFLYNVLKSEAYLRGSLYYPLPETFLCQLARLTHKFKEHFESTGMAKLVAEKVAKRVGLPGTALALAMRLLACDMCGVKNDIDRQQLTRLQNVDGSWDVCPFYSYNDPKSWWGNEITTTAYAAAVLRQCHLESRYQVNGGLASLYS